MALRIVGPEEGMGRDYRKTGRRLKGQSVGGDPQETEEMPAFLPWPGRPTSHLSAAKGPQTSPFLLPWGPT